MGNANNPRLTSPVKSFFAGVERKFTATDDLWKFTATDDLAKVTPAGNGRAI